jgi:Bacterial pre-peptidase C-terminal domain
MNFSHLNRLSKLVLRHFLVAALGVSSLALAQIQAPAPIASANIGEVGHSLVNTTMPAMLVPVAQSLQKQIQMTVQVINGAPLRWQWDGHTNAERKGLINPAFTDLFAALPTLRPDVLVLTERVDIAGTMRWENTIGYVNLWVERARAANPNVRPYLYSTWFNSALGPWNTDVPNRTVWRTRIESDGLLYEQVARAAGIQMVPGHRAMMALYDAIAAGQVPGYTSIESFFSDDIHLNGMGNYYIALVHYATIFKASPIGAVIPPGAGVSAALAQQLQQMAWSVVSGYSLSGATGETNPTAGACGAANGSALAAAPTSNLCTAGTASAVAGTGPYTWSCAGTNGGATASCLATRPATATNGTCGNANGVAVRTAPNLGLCATGTPSSVMGVGPFAWSCTGLNSGTTAGCSAPVLSSPTNGACGASNGGSFTGPPTSNLCLAGSATSVTGAGPFTWGCSGSNGGTTAACAALLTPPPAAPVSGICGGANGVAASAAPAAGLCTIGAATAVTGAGPFVWSCTGLNGGSPAACAAPRLLPAVAGVCGASNGGSFASAPAANLCQAGTATAVSGVGPFAWSCTGANGGPAASCQASLASPVIVPGRTVNTIGSLAQGASQFFTFQVPAGVSSVAFVLTGNAGDSDLFVSRGAQLSRNSAFWKGNSSSPNEQVTLTRPYPGTYYVEVYGYSATSGVVLTTTIVSGATGGATPTAGACGASNGGSFTGPPTSNLCLAGSATSVTGAGPFTWGCSGSNGGTTAACAALLTPPPAAPVSGICGGANGVAASAAPAAGLCTIGAATAVTGAGPFVWSCTGLNGGSPAACAAPRLLPAVAGVCGASNGGSFASAPAANLCQAGTATAVSGVGPFAWSCTGANGGPAASCQASLASPVIVPGRTVNTIGSLAQGASQFFTFQVPAGVSSVAFVLTGTAGDSDLFVSRDAQLSRNSAFWKGNSSSPNEQVIQTRPYPGTYYVEVYGYSATTGVVLTTTITR